MKKLLLSLLCVIGLVGIASADTYTYTYVMSEIEGFGSVTNSALGQWVCDGFTFTPDKGTGTTAPAYNKAGDVRIYANNTLTVAATDANILSISFDISSQGVQRFPEITPSTGAIAQQGANPLVWNGSAPSVTFSVSEKAVHSADPSKNGQFDFTAVTITTDAPVGEAQQYTSVTSLSQLANAAKGVKFSMDVDLTIVYVYDGNVYAYDGKDYAMLYRKGGLGVEATNVIAKGWKGETDVYNGLTELLPVGELTVSGTAALPQPIELDAEMASVSLVATNQNMYIKLLGVTFADATPSSRANFTGTMGEGDDAVSVTFRNNYMLEAVTAGTYDVVAFIGVYNSTVQIYPVEYIGNSGVVELPVLENFNMLYDLENGTDFKVGVDLKVVYSSGDYTYVNDGFQNALIYKKGGVNVATGDLIAKDWNASLSIYNGLYEIVPAGELTITEHNVALPEPLEVTAEDVNMFVAGYNQAAYLKLIDVAFDAETPAKGSFTGIMGENTVNFYQRFNLESVAPAVYDVVGFVAVFNETVQVYPISFTWKSELGVEGIANDLTPAKYYNLQGIEVNNPQPGNLYIRVQGDKASKIIVR